MHVWVQGLSSLTDSGEDFNRYDPEGEDFGETEGKHEGVFFFLSRFQFYREGVTDYTARSRVTLHTDGLLCDVSVTFVLLLSEGTHIQCL